MPCFPMAPLEGQHISALMKAIKSANICVFFQTPDLVYRWVENPPEFLKDKWRPLARDMDIFEADKADQLESKKLQVLATGECQNIEICFKYRGESIWYNFSIDCHKDAQGAVIGLVTTGVNVSKVRRREQVLKILLREVCHRSKNLLAIIQSIATQTARHSDSMPNFLRKFQGRLQSLSHSQDLVTHSNWLGASFKELVRSQVQNDIGTETPYFSLEGIDPYLFPSAALHIGLAIHELLINSLSFGALSQNEGHVCVSCHMVEAEDFEASQGNKIEENKTKIGAVKDIEKHALTIIWRETFNPHKPIEVTDFKTQFGSIVLEKIVPSAVFGTACYDICSKGVTYTLTLPSSQFDLNTQL